MCLCSYLLCNVAQLWYGVKYLMGPYNAGPNFAPAPLMSALITPVSKSLFRHLGPALKGPPDIFIEITYLKSCAEIREAENNFHLMKKLQLC